MNQQSMTAVVVRARLWAMLIVRTLGLGLIAAGLVVISAKIPGYWYGAKQDGRQWFAAYYLIWYLLPGSLTVLIGFAVMAISRRIIPFLVPVPRTGCLQCGYSADGLSTGPCPECGCRAVNTPTP